MLCHLLIVLDGVGLLNMMIATLFSIINSLIIFLSYFGLSLSHVGLESI